MKNFEEAKGLRDGKIVTVLTRLTKVSGKLVIAGFVCNFVKFSGCDKTFDFIMLKNFNHFRVQYIQKRIVIFCLA